MKVILTKDFKGVKDGEVYPELFEAGAEVEGDLAAAAVTAGCADAPAPEKAPDAAGKAPAANKKLAGAPENK